MPKPRAFLEVARRRAPYREAEERIKDSKDVRGPALSGPEMQEQGSACMGCANPFCHGNCPTNNRMNVWNRLVGDGREKEARRDLEQTNYGAEFTAKICPAPCEAGCTLNIGDNPITIKDLEGYLVEKAHAEGWVSTKTRPKNGKRIAIIGGGPAGMACAEGLATLGYDVDLFDKNKKIGGLLRYGIPDFKMEKHIIDRRLAVMAKKGVKYHTEVHVGSDAFPFSNLEGYEAVVFATGGEVPRDVPIPGRDANNIHFAMPFLTGQNRFVSGELPEAPINVQGKRVLVIGGGDTGSDCIGTSARQGAYSITQVEFLPRPPDEEFKEASWPEGRLWKLRHSTSHEDAALLPGGFKEHFAVNAKRFLKDEAGNLTGVEFVKLKWNMDYRGRPVGSPIEVPRRPRVLKVDVVFIAAGFVGTPQEGLMNQAGIKLANGKAEAGSIDFQIYHDGKQPWFAIADTRRGQDLVVAALGEGRRASRAIDTVLKADRPPYWQRGRGKVRAAAHATA